MKRLIVFWAICVTLSVAAQDRVYVEASELTLVGKLFENTPNPYHRLDPEKYFGFDPVEAEQIRMSAGIAVAFRTDSECITVRPEYGANYDAWTSGHLSAKGFDLYSKQNGEWKWAGCAVIPEGTKERVALKAKDKVMTEYLLYLPLFSEMKSVLIGVDEDSAIEPLDNPFKRRIGVYGSSFTHGTSTTHPAMNYPSQLSRMTGYQFLNMGMAGHCLMQDYMLEPLCDADVDAYIFDTFSNPSAEIIEERLFGFIETLQAAKPGIPLIFQKTIKLGWLTYDRERQENERRKQETVDRLMKQACSKYKDVYYIDSTVAEDRKNETTVDGIHPNDYGYTLWAKSVAKPLTRILRKYR